MDEPYFVSRQAECMILLLWCDGKDTRDIALALALPEYEIANRLPKLLEQREAAKMPPVSFWTDENVEWLKRLWAEGKTCSEIAAVMGGGATRNSVIGKIHRLGLNGREYVKVKRSPEEIALRLQQKNQRGNERRRQYRSYAPARPEMPVCEEVVSRNLTLLDLGPDDCKWPYGDNPFTFCGNLIFHGPYCASHYFASIGPGTHGERTAEKAALHVAGAA